MTGVIVAVELLVLVIIVFPLRVESELVRRLHALARLHRRRRSAQRRPTDVAALGVELHDSRQRPSPKASEPACLAITSVRSAVMACFCFSVKPSVTSVTLTNGTAFSCSVGLEP
jgi:hypothetical protein